MYGFNYFNVYQLVSLALIGSNFAHDEFDFSNLNNLGHEINQRVNKELGPLKNLGARISANVHRHLDHLGERIQQSVQKGLEPVRAQQILLKMKNGVGGTTIAKFLPEGKTFVIKKHQMFTCNGSISEKGKCGGSLTRFEIKDKKDHCYSNQGFSTVKDQICIGASHVALINDKITCETSTGTPALLMSIDEFSKLCGESRTVEYKYIAKHSNRDRVKIPNKNKHVKCSNKKHGVCIFTETNSLQNSNGNVIINSASTSL